MYFLSFIREMKQLLSDFQIDPNEPQIKLKQNIFRRFKEIHDEHEKELRRIKVMNPLYEFKGTL